MPKMRLSILLFILFFIAGCSNNNSNYPSASMTYPMKVGNSWDYTREFIEVEVDHPDQVYKRATGEFYIEFTTVDTLVNGQPAFRLYESWEEQIITEQDTSTYQGATNTWYKENDYGLYVVAYGASNSAVSPKVAPQNTYRHGRVRINDSDLFNLRLENLAEWQTSTIDTIKYEVSPPKTLRYPMDLFIEWYYRQPYSPFTIKKEIIGRTAVTSTAGSFDCFIVRWLGDMNDDEIVDYTIKDYISEIGLVKRNIVFEDFDKYNANNVYLGTFDIEIECELTSYQVNSE